MITAILLPAILSEDVTQNPTEESFPIGEALARYLLAIRNELNSEYVANCIRFRNRNGTGANCPQDTAINASSHQQEQALVDELFSIITREGEYVRISRQLESKMKRWRQFSVIRITPAPCRSARN